MMETAVMDTTNDERMVNDLRRACPRGLRIDESMAKHTTIGAGGHVRFFAAPTNTREIALLVRAAVKHGVPYIGVGRGSNLLVRDGGYDGLIIKVASNVADLKIYKETAYAEAGLSFTKLGKVLTRHGRPGYEFAIGIPGSVGGAVRMNAGAFGSDLSKVLKSVKMIDEAGRISVLQASEIAFRYRQSSLPRGAIVLSAVFKCPPGAMDDERLRRTLSRKETQPLSDRSFGSTFTNPPGGFAAEMIEACGLKGKRRGGVMISKKHANFVINVGENTRANDAEDLIEFVRQEVNKRYGVRLKPEVIIIGNR